MVTNMNKGNVKLFCSGTDFSLFNYSVRDVTHNSVNDTGNKSHTFQDVYITV
jgi:hypothetical protein